ncbi:MAG: hypothetical protein A2075_07810 [Geobacteraceae bacterium GWC2_58_44]|nr:MAG: hypothetical protein A2075_07810 [Geobacteraceae bacterium GWC2_58_44]HBG05858.1 hypothetical protein [Geobacter sp.]
MKKSLKGALLSGLILPGIGQLWLKHYLRGIALIAAVSACLALVVMKALRQAVTMLEKIEAEGGAVDIVAILSSASHSSALSDGFMSASTGILLCWIVGIVDAYLIGRKKDLAEQSKDTKHEDP